MREPLNVGLVGAGFAAHIHARAYQRLADLDVRLAAATALPVGQAEALAREYGIPAVCASLRPFSNGRISPSWISACQTISTRSSASLPPARGST